MISKVRAALTWKERVQYAGTLPPRRADRIGLNAYGNKPADPRNWNKPKWLKKQGPLSKLTKLRKWNQKKKANKGKKKVPPLSMRDAKAETASSEDEEEHAPPRHPHFRRLLGKTVKQ